jgi:hypothetical protein
MHSSFFSNSLLSGSYGKQCYMALCILLNQHECLTKTLNTFRGLKSDYILEYVSDMLMCYYLIFKGERISSNHKICGTC